jgi:alpha/beta superfamily hydrolase
MTERVYRERVRIPSRHGQLAAELAYGLGAAGYACLLVNPHPYMGGHMNNNVIAHLASRLAEENAVTLRFDYSGVGESDGPAVDVAEALARFWATGDSPQDPQMVEDVRCVADWLRREVRLPLVLVGYSFGSHAALAALADDVRAVILISPTVGHHDFAALARSSIPKLVIYSDNDFATPVERTTAWFEEIAEPKSARCLQAGDHFFKGQENSVAGICGDFIARAMSCGEGASCRC